MLLAILLQIFLIFLNAVFACAEIAVVSVSEARYKTLAEKGDKRAQKILKLKKNPSKFLATIQVAITLSGFLGSAFAAENFAGPLVNLLLKTGISISRGVLESICVIVITIIIAFFSIVFGELVPKRIAMQKKEGISLGLSGMLRVVSKIFAPIVWLLTASTNLVLKLLRVKATADEVTEEEIKSMVESSSASGMILQDENEIIQNVFELNDTSISEICTHRVDVIHLKTTDTFAKWKKTIYNTKHSYYPVCAEKIDDVIGIIDVKDFFRLNIRTKEEVLSIVKKPFFVPESMKANILFNKMKELGNYFAVVVDEYGGMTGIVTLRDLLEVLVGDLEDEKEINSIQEGVYKVLGTASVDEVNEILNVKIDVTEYDTFGGYVLALLGEVPEDGETPIIETDEMEIKVEKVCKRRIISCLVTKKQIVEIQ